MNKAFDHRPAAHCETGAIANLLRHHGLKISEPMVFGLSGALTFAYIKLIRINGMPLIAYRLPPMMIIRLLARRIEGLSFRFRRFRDEGKGMRTLDEMLAQGRVIGVQTSVFFLPYFPQAMRFHFNAHNLLVYGKEGDEYQISDPVFSHLVTANTNDLRQARFARGVLAPKGLMYYPERIPREIDYPRVIPKAIRFMARMNGKWNPVPIAGIRGMRRLAREIERLSDHRDQRHARLLMGHIVRMQEEIGTGGAGFRFIYAAFLQEAGEIMNSGVLRDCANELTGIGDEWRDFAVLAARLCKQRPGQDYRDAAARLRKISALELSLYDRLSGYRGG